ncbi:MAG: hypothetical protein HYX97_04335 [Chloroflexi bacterium]|nr:hypothetical protein [Chloroflexota bacterium]
MGLDVGIIHITYLPRPTGAAYRFAWELAYHAGAYGYMHGDGNNWGWFTQRRVLRMLDDFAREKALSASVKREVLDWVRSLPWDGWRDGLDLSRPLDDDDDDLDVDGPDDEHGGLIELHFNW